MGFCALALLTGALIGCGDDDGTVDDDLGTEPDLGSAGDCCVDEAVRWGSNGGLVSFRDSYRWQSCATVVKTREDLVMGEPSPVCELDLSSSECALVDAVAAALAAPGLADARSAAPVVYGVDSRPVDGTVFRIELDGDVIDVGGECEDREGCDPIPEAVAALRDALLDVTAVVDGTTECMP
jgi:hypothetical protein